MQACRELAADLVARDPVLHVAVLVDEDERGAAHREDTREEPAPAGGVVENPAVKRQRTARLALPLWKVSKVVVSPTLRKTRLEHQTVYLYTPSSLPKCLPRSQKSRVGDDYLLAQGGYPEHASSGGSRANLDAQRTQHSCGTEQVRIRDPILRS